MNSISASQIKRFQKCRRVWWIGQKLGRKLRPYSNMIVGIMAHNLLENSILGLKYDLQSDLQNHTNQLSGKEIERLNSTIMDKTLYDKLKQAKKKIVEIIGTKDVEIEKHFEYKHKTPNGDVQIHGYLDIVNPKTGDVFDLKIGQRALYETYVRQNYTVQMELYRWGAKNEYKLDNIPKVTIISVGLQAGTVVPFEMPIMPLENISRMLTRIAEQMKDEEKAEYEPYNGFCEVCGEPHEFIEYTDFDQIHRKLTQQLDKSTE